MGVPAFFRWLSRKYPSIVVHCVEEKRKNVDGVQIPVDTSLPNPNDTEFDNLYLDMNGIIHPCCHPENKPAPANEDEMMVDIFEYIDRIFSIVRPRKLLYMAIDGVAPRAKMNQQRSRRFRASKESIEKREDIARIKDELRSKGCEVPPDKPESSHFDSNCITPGTPFMFRLAECLRYYIHDRLNSDPGWQGIKVILSDANVPGEGEHKIMDYIRRQRAQPDHDPNTHHCLCGADADLIMLGLATHEPHFTIIREEFKPNQPRPCEICGQIGHDMKECTGAAKEKQGEHDELNSLPAADVEFIFLRLNVLREYLEKELQMTNLPFKQDMERAIDDWVFMCFFVGNDFLPHLPSLEIREGAIDRLVKLYKKAVYKTGGYLTDSGVVNLARVQLVMQDLGEVEDEIFKKRREDEQNFRKRNKAKRMRERQMKEAQRPSFLLQGDFAPRSLGSRDTGGAVNNPRQAAYEQRMSNMGRGSNEDAAAQLRSMMKDGNSDHPRGEKRKAESQDPDSDPEPEDEVKLWEDGWKDRYYESKFDVGSEDLEFRYKVANEYVIGLCWVLRYYYQGCASWKWYFPYHYAPFASDFLNIGDLPNDFEKFTQPFKPLEQLMGVFPAASKKFLPPTWQELMTSPESAIIDFYPTNFKIDLNGKKYAWQGVALLPFVDEKRLKKALKEVYPDLTPAEISRNIRGPDRLFVGGKHPAHDFLEGLYESGGMSEDVDIITAHTQGMGGKVKCDKVAVLSGQTVTSPIPGKLPDLSKNRAISVEFCDPQFDPDFHFPAKVLPGARFPGKVLKPEDFEAMFRFSETNGRGGRGRGRGGFRGGGGRGGGGFQGGYRPQLGFQPHSGYRQQGSVDTGPLMRNIRHGLGPQNNYPPPESYSTSRSGNRGNGGNRGGNGGGQGNHRNFYQSDSWNASGGRQGGNGGGYGGGRSSGYGQGAGYRQEGGGNSLNQGGYGAWQGNMRNQGNAYQQNQQRGYQQQRGGGGGHRGQNQQRSNNNRGNYRGRY